MNSLVRILARSFAVATCAILAAPGNAAPIHDAARNGDLAAIKTIVAADPGALTQRDDDQRTALLVAAYGGHYPVVEFLLAAGSDQTAVDKDGRNALHLAAQSGVVAIVRHLLDAGFAINTRDNIGATPLLWASASWRKTAHPEGGSSIKYSYEENISIARLLLDRGADPRIKHNEIGVTALHVAAQSGNPHIVTLLLGAAKDLIDAPSTQSGTTPLHHAAARGNGRVLREDSSSTSYEYLDNLQAARLLIGAGANVNAVTRDEKSTPLMFAAGFGLSEVTDALIAAGADVSKQNANGQTALHLAAATGGRLLQQIVYKGGGGDKVDESGRRYTAQYSLITTPDNRAAITALLLAGADPNIKDRNGRTPLEIARESGNAENVKAFESFVKK